MAPKYSVLLVFAVIILSSCNTSKNLNSPGSDSYQRLMIIQQFPPQKLEGNAAGASQPIAAQKPAKNLVLSLDSSSPKPPQFTENIIKSGYNNPFALSRANKLKSISALKKHIRVKDAYGDDDEYDNRPRPQLTMFLNLLIGCITLGYLLVEVFSHPITLTSFFNVFGGVITLFSMLIFLRYTTKLIYLIVAGKNGDLKHTLFIKSLIVLLLAIPLCLIGVVLVINNSIYYSLLNFGIEMLGVCLIILAVYALYIGIATIAGTYKEKKREKALPDF